MNKFKNKFNKAFVKTLFSTLVSIIIILLFYFLRTEKNSNWYSIIPPILAVNLAFITNRLLVSLGIAVLSGGLLVHGMTSSNMFEWALKIITKLGLYELEIVLFVGFILAMISIIIKAGGFEAIVHWLSKKATSIKSSQVITSFMGIVIFIDDYANTMIVGSTMRSITDKFKISREKLAFIVDATSAPVAGVALISTWVSFEVGLFEDQSKLLHLGTNGYAMLLDALQYRFYCYIMLLFVFINAFSGKDFSSMKKAQERSINEEKLFSDDSKPMTSNSFSIAEPEVDAKLRIKTAVIPLVSLVALLFLGLWLDGGGFAKTKQDVFSFLSLENWKVVITKASNAKVLLISAFLSMLIAGIMAFSLAKIKLNSITISAYSGFKSSLLPVMILVLAWFLKSTCDILDTGDYIVAVLGDKVSPFWFPVVLFSISGLISFGIGTSWGTMSILIPTATPLALALDGGQYGLITTISLAAILDGAIFGDHCSPISDTTIMSSIASSCDHLDHVSTQIPYSVAVGLIALVFGYIPAAAGISSYYSILGSAIFLTMLFYFLSKYKLNEN